MNGACRGRIQGLPTAVLFCSVLLVLDVLGPTPAAGQEEILSLAQECGGEDATTLDRCREVALRTQAARGVVGLVAGGGPELPGSAGTVGLRIGNVPRISVAARFNAAHASFTGRLPPVGDPLPDGTLSAADVFVTGLDLTGGVGLFDGFSPLPTVGGVLSLDVLATGSFLFLPEDRGFPSSEFVFGAGARLGLLRESFSLPGVSASVVRRWGGEMGVEGGGGVGSGAFDVSSTSLRVTAGKDLVGVGLLLGAGLDRHSGAVSISTTGAMGPVGDPAWDATVGELPDTRPVFFGGASLNYLVLQLSAEVGWVGGFEPVPDRPSGYDPTKGSWFGGLGARLTY
ncbi:MAG: hypothetical protein ACOC8K_00045 [Gemmatimonadota bacterium]